MSFIHDIIKIKYVRLGYLPNYPYHMISDKEMFDAFISNGEESDNTFFGINYSNPFAEEDYIYQKKNREGEVIAEISLSGEYAKLKQYIIDTISKYLSAEITELPNWIYTYMLGDVVYDKSEHLDIHDTLALLQVDSIDDEFTQIACVKCYITSLKYISTLTSGTRPPTVFGEPHILKQLRLEV